MKKQGCLWLLLLLLLTGCGEVYPMVEQPKHTIGVVLKAMNSQYWMEIRSGMEQAAADRDADLLLLAPYDEKAGQEQAEHIRNLLDSGVDVLLVAPCDSYHTAWFVELAGEKGVPVLTVDTRALDSELPYIGADNAGIGRMAADYLAGKLTDGAQIAVLSGLSMQSTHTARVAAFLEELNQMGRFAVPEVYYTEGEFSQGYDCARLDGCGRDFLHQRGSGAWRRDRAGTAGRGRLPDCGGGHAGRCDGSRAQRGDGGADHPAGP